MTPRARAPPDAPGARGCPGVPCGYLGAALRPVLRMLSGCSRAALALLWGSLGLPWGCSATDPGDALGDLAGGCPRAALALLWGSPGAALGLPWGYLLCDQSWGSSGCPGAVLGVALECSVTDLLACPRKYSKQDFPRKILENLRKTKKKRSGLQTESASKFNNNI